MGLQKAFKRVRRGPGVAVPRRCVQRFQSHAMERYEQQHCPFLGYAPCVIDDRQTNAESHFGYVSAARPGRLIQLNARFVF